MLGKQESDLSDETKVLLVYARGAKKRRCILKALRLAPRNCNQLAQELDSDWWTIQKHLQLLVKGALIKTVNFGRMKFYKITPKGDLALKLASNINRCPTKLEDSEAF